MALHRRAKGTNPCKVRLSEVFTEVPLERERYMLGHNHKILIYQKAKQVFCSKTTLFLLGNHQTGLQPFIIVTFGECLLGLSDTQEPSCKERQNYICFESCQLPFFFRSMLEGKQDTVSGWHQVRGLQIYWFHEYHAAFSQCRSRILQNSYWQQQQGKRAVTIRPKPEDCPVFYLHIQITPEREAAWTSQLFLFYFSEL